MSPSEMSDKELSEFAYAAYIECAVTGAGKRSKAHRWLMQLRDEARRRFALREDDTPQAQPEPGK